MKKYLLVLGLALVAGCGPAVVDNQTDVSVGTVDGKELRRVKVSGDGNVHYVYYFPTDHRQPVSNNMRMGKTGTVIVMIDNKPVSTNIIYLEDPK